MVSSAAKKRGKSFRLSEVCSEAVLFRRARDWERFHTPKDLLLSLIRESSELAEILLWKEPAELPKLIAKNRRQLGDELADVLSRVVLLAHDFGIDLDQAWRRKQAINRRKYPIKRFYGRNSKSALGRSKRS
jgi:NTP pyrophosphatase (non-canonical NTP hydrolase)